MSIKLSKRLMTIVEMCEPCDTIIDVGTDHGKVPIEIANRGFANNVIAIDNKVGPLEICKNNADLYIENKKCHFYTLLSDGLEKVDKSIETGIIITGLGFDTISKMLLNINEYNFKYLILSPHTKVTELIKLIDELKLKIFEQKNVFEDDKYYYIFKVYRN